VSTIATRGAVCSSNTGATLVFIEKHGWCEIQAKMMNTRLNMFFKCRD